MYIFLINSQTLLVTMGTSQLAIFIYLRLAMTLSLQIVIKFSIQRKID
jgi:hypothetical protein